MDTNRMVRMFAGAFVPKIAHKRLGVREA